MKKTLKRVICFMFAVCMMLTTVLIPETNASAASAPKKAHTRIKQVWSTEGINVKLDKDDYKIANLKSSSKNLILRITSTNSASEKNVSSVNDTVNPFRTAKISMYAKKKGTYTVTFDVIGRDKKVNSSHSVKVYANDDYAIKNVTFAGKPFYFNFLAKSKGKFKVSMNKGYQLKSIMMTTYDKKGKTVTKKIKNGKSVTLGNYRRMDKYTDTSTNEEWSANIFAESMFAITYKDKYSGELVTTTYMLRRLPKN